MFGGTAPLIATALISVLDSDLAPAYMLIAAAVFVLPVIMKTPETAPVRVGSSD